METQRLQRAAQFLAARRQAVACGQDSCSGTVRSQCATWLESIERALPTLVIDARDGTGAVLAEVRVEANGELLAERLNGRALELDPGEYVLRLSHGQHIVEQRTLIREAEKYRKLEVRFEAAPGRAAALRASEPPLRAPQTSPPVAALPGASGASDGTSSAPPGRDAPASLPTASYLLGGLGLASLTTSAVLATSGYASERHLRNTCAGACSAKEVESVRTRYLIADAALGVGIASLAAAVAVWLGTPREPSVSGRLSLGPRHVAFEGEF